MKKKRRVKHRNRKKRHETEGIQMAGKRCTWKEKYGETGKKYIVLYERLNRKP